MIYKEITEKDKKIRRLMDQRFKGSEDQKINGLEDQRLRSSEDQKINELKTKCDLKQITKLVS